PLTRWFFAAATWVRRFFSISARIAARSVSVYRLPFFLGIESPRGRGGGLGSSARTLGHRLIFMDRRIITTSVLGRSQVDAEPMGQKSLIGLADLLLVLSVV